MTTDVFVETDGSPENAAQRAEDARDLKKQLGNLGLDDAENQFFILKETSPPRRKTQLWSMEDGSSNYFFNFRIAAMLNQTMDDGRPRWTARKERAPAMAISTYACFLAPESEIRAELDSLGITVRCKSKHPSKFAMEQVASKKHPGSWKAWQAHLAEKDRKKWEEQQSQQVAAMMALARNAAGPSAEGHGSEWLDNIQKADLNAAAEASTSLAVDLVEGAVVNTMTCECGWTTTKGLNSIAAHKRMHCPLREGA